MSESSHLHHTNPLYSKCASEIKNKWKLHWGIGSRTAVGDGGINLLGRKA